MWLSRLARSVAPTISRTTFIQPIHQQWSQLYPSSHSAKPHLYFHAPFSFQTWPLYRYSTCVSSWRKVSRPARRSLVLVWISQLWVRQIEDICSLHTPHAIQLTQTSATYPQAAQFQECLRDAKSSIPPPSSRHTPPTNLPHDLYTIFGSGETPRNNIQIMLNRLRQNQNEGQWRTSQQLANKQKSPQKIQEEYPNYHPRGQENQFAVRNTHSQILKTKPLISPRQANVPTNPLSHRPSHNIPERSCLNHPSKRAQFTTSEQEQQYYCGRCAAQLATRGCQVIRLEAAGLRVSKRNQLPHYPEYQHEPIYQQIMQILRFCNSGISQHTHNIDRFASLQQEYQQQMDITSAFYDRLIQIIAEMKSDHLFDLAQQRDKYTQIADIENDHLRENIIEINVIKNDIENHLQQVLKGIRQSGNAAECRQSLDHYKQKLTLFEHQLEEQIDSLQSVTRYPQQKIDSMLQEFEEFLKVLWDTPSQPLPQQQHIQRPIQQQHTHQPTHMQLPQQQQPQHNLNSALTVKNIHQILPRGVNDEGRRAFRNLQQEEQEEEPFMDRKSPNFKKI